MATYLLEFAGVPFVSDDARAAVTDGVPASFRSETFLLDEIEKKLPLEWLQEYLPPAEPPYRNLNALADRRMPMPTKVGIGQWFYPTGANRWSVFRGIATSSQVAAMLEAVQNPAAHNSSAPLMAGTFKMKSVPDVPPGTATEEEYALETTMFLLPPRPLFETLGLDGFYLVTLVDQRYFFQGSSVTLHATPGTEWTDLIDQIAAALVITIDYDWTNDFGGAFDTIEELVDHDAPYFQPEPDSQLWTNQESAGVLLDAIAANIGRVVVRNLDGTFALDTWEDSDAQAKLNRGDAGQVVRSAGGDVFCSGTMLDWDLTGARNAVCPAYVQVTFPKYVYGSDPVPHFVDPRIAAGQTAWFRDSYGEVWTESVPIASGGSFVSGVSGVSQHTIHTTSKALYETDADAAAEDPVNASGIASLAMKLATDHWSSLSVLSLDEVYPGTFLWTPEGIHDILWTYSARKGASIRVMRPPWNAVVTETQHSDPLPGLTDIPPGTGGLNPAITWRDQFGSGAISPVYLKADMTSGALTATLNSATGLPTNYRWRGNLYLGSGNLTSGTGSGNLSGQWPESFLFEGSSGGLAVGIVARGQAGTIQGPHNSGDKLWVELPRKVYSPNLVTAGSGLVVQPGVFTSGGIVELLIGLVSGAAGSATPFLKVEEQDESPSLSGIRMLAFNQADGFFLSGTSASGYALVNKWAPVLTQAVGGDLLDQPMPPEILLLNPTGTSGYHTVAPSIGDYESGALRTIVNMGDFPIAIARNMGSGEHPFYLQPRCMVSSFYLSSGASSGTSASGQAMWLYEQQYMNRQLCRIRTAGEYQELVASGGDYLFFQPTSGNVTVYGIRRPFYNGVDEDLRESRMLLLDVAHDLANDQTITLAYSGSTGTALRFRLPNFQNVTLRNANASTVVDHQGMPPLLMVYRPRLGVWQPPLSINIASGIIWGYNLSATAGTSGQVLTWNSGGVGGLDWADPGAGFSLTSGIITSGYVGDGSIRGGDGGHSIISGSIGGGDLGSGAIVGPWHMGSGALSIPQNVNATNTNASFSGRFLTHFSGSFAWTVPTVGGGLVIADNYIAGEPISGLQPVCLASGILSGVFGELPVVVAAQGASGLRMPAIGVLDQDAGAGSGLAARVAYLGKVYVNSGTMLLISGQQGKAAYVSQSGSFLTVVRPGAGTIQPVGVVISGGLLVNPNIVGSGQAAG